METPIAVIGAGLIGLRHADLVAASTEARLAAVVEPDAAVRARAAAKGHPVLADIADLPDDVRGAIVATPNATHGDVAAACAARGLALLVEKPIGATLDEGRRVIAAARDAGVPLLVGHHRRHHACVIAAKGLIEAGALGRVAAVSAMWAMRKPDAYFADAWRVAAGGGPVLINLIHDIDMLRHLVGEIVEVRALTADALRGGPVEDGAAAALRFEGGAVGTAVLSDAALSPWSWEGGTGENPMIPRSGADPLHIAGTEGALSLPSMSLWRFEGEGEADWTRALSRTALPAPATRPLEAQLAHFIRVARGEAAPAVSGEDALGSLAATLAVVEAAGHGRAVRPGDQAA